MGQKCRSMKRDNRERKKNRTKRKDSKKMVRKEESVKPFCRGRAILSSLLRGTRLSTDKEDNSRKASIARRFSGEGRACVSRQSI